MMHSKKDQVLMLIGRILLGALFLISGYNKIGAFDGVLAFMGSAGLPESAFLLWVVILLEILGGLALILGVKVKLVSWVLVVFVLLATFFFHLNLQDVNLLKNLAVIGGLLYVITHGAGTMSLDTKLNRTSPSPADM